MNDVDKIMKVFAIVSILCVTLLTISLLAIVFKYVLL